MENGGPFVKGGGGGREREPRRVAGVRHARRWTTTANEAEGERPFVGPQIDRLARFSSVEIQTRKRKREKKNNSNSTKILKREEGRRGKRAKQCEWGFVAPTPDSGGASLAVGPGGDGWLVCVCLRASALWRGGVGVGESGRRAVPFAGFGSSAAAEGLQSG